MTDQAHRILEIFAHFRSEADDVLLANNFVAVGSRRGWRMSDLQHWLEQAQRCGWIEAADRGWRLTSAGFEESVKEHATVPFGRG